MTHNESLNPGYFIILKARPGWRGQLPCQLMKSQIPSVLVTMFQSFKSHADCHSLSLSLAVSLSLSLFPSLLKI